nr:unnamed protein product [Haemonchus contortus]
MKVLQILVLAILLIGCSAFHTRSSRRRHPPQGHHGKKAPNRNVGRAALFRRPAVPIQSAPVRPLEGNILVQEPYFPREIPLAPKGQKDCDECPWISTTNCRRGQTSCVEPLITYNKRGCSGSATVQCTASGRDITLAVKGGRNWMQLQSSPFIREQLYCREGKWLQTGP